MTVTTNEDDDKDQNDDDNDLRCLSEWVNCHQNVLNFKISQFDPKGGWGGKPYCEFFPNG